MINALTFDVEEYFHAEVFAERVHDLRCFVQAQQSRVHENARQLIADGPMDQRCRNSRVDAA